MIALALRLLYRTLRLRYVDPGGVLARRSEGGPVLITFWHDTIALMPLVVVRCGWPARVNVLLSWHRDAEIAARAMTHFGIRAVRGSSTRGRLGGIRGLLAAYGRAEDIAVVPDGPRGPRHRAKDGVVQLARATGLAITPFGAAAWPARRLGSWDRLQIPWPFARVTVVVGERVEVPREVDRAGVAAAVDAVEASLARATARALAAVGAPAP
jgi:hypothetical protein